jgi:hypothetical protein
MPYPSEHAARVTSPKKYKSFKRKKIAPGISMILGITDDGTETQAYRFDKTMFTPAQAKAWLKSHNIMPIMFEDAVDIQSFNITIQCESSKFSQQEIIALIPIDILNKIKSKDSHPFFTAYSIAHEGTSNPKILNDDNSNQKPITWMRKAIQSIANKALIGIKFFSKHNKDNSTNNRKIYGEVIAETQKEINGVLHHIVIGYHPKDVIDDVKKMDVCSQEGIWNLLDKGTKYIAKQLDKITGIALGKSSEDIPAFAGAQQLGMVQAFNKQNEDLPGRKNQLEVPTKEQLFFAKVEDIAAVIKERDIWPNQIFKDHDKFLNDRVYRQVYEERDKYKTTIESLQAELKAKNEENVKYRVEREQAIRNADLGTAKNRLDKLVQIKNLTDHQKIVIAKEFKPDKMQDLSDNSLYDFISNFIMDYQEKAAAGVYGQQQAIVKQAEGASAVTPKVDDMGNIDYNDPTNNPLLMKEDK